MEGGGDRIAMSGAWRPCGRYPFGSRMRMGGVARGCAAEEDIAEHLMHRLSCTRGGKGLRAAEIWRHNIKQNGNYAPVVAQRLGDSRLAAK